MWPRKWLTSFVWLILFCAPGCALANEQPISIESTSQLNKLQTPRLAGRNLVIKAANVFSGSTGIALDVSVINSAVAEVYNFYSIYGALPACRSLLFGENQKFLAQTELYFRVAILDRRSPVKTLYARLASGCGSSAAASGWPSKSKNAFGVVIFQRPPLAVSRLESAGTVYHYPVVTRGIAFIAGEYKLKVLSANGLQAIKVIDVSPNAEKLWSTVHASDEHVLPLSISVRLPNRYYCLSADRLAKRPRFGHFTSGSARGRSATFPRARFSSAAAAIVDVGAPKDTCPKSCQIGLGDLLARTIAGWLGICADCKRDSLVALRIGNVAYILPAVIKVLHNPAERISAFRRDNATGLEPIERNGWLEEHSLEYLRFQIGSQRLKGICKRISEAKRIWMSAVVAAVCETANAGAARLVPVMHVQFLEGGTRCGPARDFIACGTVDTGIQVTLTDAQYVWQDNAFEKRDSIGSGSQQFNLQYVLLHEVGHWMGLRDYTHPARSQYAHYRIMGDYYHPRGACISSAEVQLLAAAADTAWAGRLANCSGMRRP